MAMDHHHLFGDPVASSVSSQEVDIIFSGVGGGQLPWWPDDPGLGLNSLDGDDITHDLLAPAANNPTSSGGGGVSGSGSGSGGGGGGGHRKLSHNAYERGRRKQVNELYSSLRSLLPDADHTKKLSIPTTVSRVLKYIPELQKQVESLERRKKELAEANCKPGVMTNTSESVAPVVSATCIDDTDIVVQVSLSRNVAATTLPLSKCIQVLENEGLHLISSSTHSILEDRTFYSLQFQKSERTMNKECPAFCDELERILRKKVGP
ncbi:hypothetical protein ACP4OV_005625 [Aristida adscensionis]